MYRLPFALLLVAALVVSALPLHAQSTLQLGGPPAEAAEDAQQVYRALARQFGSARTPPELVLGPTNMGLEFVPRDHAVIMSEQAYQVTQELGDEASAALAYLLGHELAHFYADHVFDRSYRQSFSDLGSTQAVTGSRVLETETQSDFLAGFKAYLAGYDAIPVAPEVLTRIYREFGWPIASTGGPTDRAHPPLEDRLKVLEVVEKDLDSFIGGFEGGVRLLIAGAYPEAGRFFARIAQSFPSREILSNAGVAKALEAIDLLGDEVRWAYPFEVDLETRLRGDRSKGGLGMGDEAHQRAMRLLEEAEELFDKAKDADPRYIPAYVNLAAVNALRGNTYMAQGNIRKAEQLAEEHGEPLTAAHARIVKAIVLAECETELPTCGDAAAIEAELQAAADLAPRLSAVNLAAWRGASPPAVEEGTGEIAYGPEETIGGISRDPDELSTFLNQRPVRLDMEVPPEGNESAMNVRVRSTEEVDAYLFGSGRSRFAVILSTPEGYRGDSGRGIRVGSSTADLTEAYGEPSRVVAARQGEFWVYDLTMIAFLVDEEGEVESWMIWEFLGM